VRSTTRTRLAPPSGPRTRDLALVVCLAGLSGVALVAHVLWDIYMSWTAGFVVLPGAILIVILVFATRGRQSSARIIADRVIAGAKWGLVATLAYDVIRPLLVWGLRLHFHPYRAHPIFGSLITGRPRDSAVAIGVGWTYHFWNGVAFGVMLALVRPRAGWATGLVWALTLQAVMMALYPKFLDVRLDNPGFLVSSIVGHGLYGIVLGSSLKRWGPS
jgi:hypothetical protein